MDFGPPTHFVSDRGSHFLNNVVSDLTAYFGIDHHFTLSYCPWSNGTIERVNRDINELLRAVLMEQELSDAHWDQSIRFIQMALNHTPSRSLHNYAPVEIMLTMPRQNPFQFDTDMEKVLHPNPLSKADIANKLTALQLSISLMNKEVLDQQVHDREASHRRRSAERNVVPIDVKIGDYVLVARREPAKLQPRWTGPAQVMDQIHPYVFKVQFVGSTSPPIQVHVTRLKYFHDQSLNVTVDIERRAQSYSPFQIEKITNLKTIDSQFYCEVFWTGFEDPTWEPLAVIYKDAPTVIKNYFSSQNLLDPRIISAAKKSIKFKI